MEANFDDIMAEEKKRSVRYFMFFSLVSIFCFVYLPSLIISCKGYFILGVPAHSLQYLENKMAVTT